MIGSFKDRSVWVKVFIFACLALCVILMAACNGPDQKKIKYFKKGKALYEKADYIGASLEFKNAIQIDPKFADGHYMLGMSELRKGNVKGALSEYAKVLELEPKMAGAHVQLGKLFLDAKEFTKAMEKAEMVLKEKPDHPEALLLKAHIMADQKNIDGALAVLDGLLKQGAKEPDAYILSALCRMQQNNSAEAERLLMEGLRHNPKNAALHMMLTEVYRHTKQIDKAIKTVENAIWADPGNTRYKFILADIFWQDGKIEKVHEILNGYVLADKKKEDAFLHTAGFYLSKAYYKDGERILAEGIQEHPKSFKLRFALADLFMNFNLSDKAIALLKECLNLGKDASSPEVIQAKNALAKIFLSRHDLHESLAYANEVLKDSPKNVDAHFTKGNIYLAKRDGLNAVSEFRTAVNERPQFIIGYVRLATAHAINREFTLANDALQKGLKIDPKSRELALAAVRVSLVQKDYTKAKGQLRKLIDEHPDDLNLWIEWGDLWLIQKDYKQAEAAYQEVKLKAPNAPAGYMKLANLYSAKGNPDKAANELEQAMKLEARPPGLLVSLVNLYVKQKRCGAAIEVLENQVKQHPLDAVAHNLIGQLYAAENNRTKSDEAYQKAIAAYEKILEKQPDAWTANNDLALILCDHGRGTGDLDRALKLAQKAQEKRPDNPLVLDTMGWIYHKKGDRNRSLDLLGKAMAKMANNASINYHMGMALYKAGKRDQARENLQRALASGEEFTGKAEAERLLGTL